jgi:hypothetical protein
MSGGITIAQDRAGPRNPLELALPSKRNQMGFPYGPNTRHPIQLWVWFALHFDNDKQPVNVRCARSNGLSLSASPLLSLTLNRQFSQSP